MSIDESHGCHLNESDVKGDRSLHEMIMRNMVSVKTPLHQMTIEGLSVAARHTTLRYNGIIMDAGACSFDMKANLLLLTHGHLDHARGYFELVGHGHLLTIICPASIARNIFNSIKDKYEMSKGREYIDAEILKMVRIIGIVQNTKPLRRCPNIEFADIHTEIVVDLKGREKTIIIPFPCHHTVDCVGYVVCDHRLKLSPQIVFQEGAEYIINMREDQPSKNTGAMDEKSIIDADAIIFSRKHGIEFECKVIPSLLPNGHVLYRRHLRVLSNGMVATKMDPTKDRPDNVILDNMDFMFLKKYNIPVQTIHKEPLLMFFGDTSDTIFRDPHIHQYMRMVRVIIIESTFLEGPESIGQTLYKRRKEKCHISLPELIPLFERYDHTDFIVMHFSAQYNVEEIKNVFASYTMFKNVIPLI